MLHCSDRMVQQFRASEVLDSLGLSGYWSELKDGLLSAAKIAEYLNSVLPHLQCKFIAC